MKSYERILNEDMNPFTLTFGVLPEQFIKRDEIKDKVLRIFNSSRNEQNVFILTGVRGSGKTVMLNNIKKEFEDLDDWIVLNVNPELNILEGIAAKLYERGAIKKYFVKPSFNFSFKGFGFSLEGDTPIKDIETLLEKMLSIIKGKGKRVLVTIDEIANTKNIKIFSHTFKNLTNDGMPIYLLATGLNENVYSLQNDKTLTFIYRARKIEIGPLNLSAISRSYMNVLGLKEDVAYKCATLTEGYASAYQILGAILFDTGKKDVDDGVISEFDDILETINYEKLWEDISMKEKQFLNGFQSRKDNKASLIIEKSGITKESYSKYRDRLIKRGVIKSDSYGYLSFALPRLFEFVQRKKLFDSLF